MAKPVNPIIAAIDTTDLAIAQTWARQLDGRVGLLKLGLAFYLAHGAAGVRAVTDKPVFLDLKLHDIPNTVAGGVTAVLPLGAAMLTLACRWWIGNDRGGPQCGGGCGCRAAEAAGSDRAHQHLRRGFGRDRCRRQPCGPGSAPGEARIKSRGRRAGLQPAGKCPSCAPK